MRKTLPILISVSLLAAASGADAKSCRNDKGKFMKCPPAVGSLSLDAKGNCHQKGKKGGVPRDLCLKAGLTMATSATKAMPAMPAAKAMPAMPAAPAMKTMPANPAAGGAPTKK